MLKGRLVAGPCVIPTFYGTKENEVEVFWLVKNRLIVMLGGMEDEVFNPTRGILAVSGLDVL